MSPDLTTTDDWVPVYTGVLKGWNEKRPNVWDLEFEPKDEKLDSPVPREKPSEADFADADPKVYDTFAPLIYGVHSSVELNDDGMIELFRIDKVNHIYLLSFGRVKGVDNCYAIEGSEAPVKLTEGTGADQWQEKFEIRSGRQWSFVEFPGGFSTYDPEKTKFVVDVRGYETVGDGTGDVITNPAEQIQHFLANFVFGDWKSGAWFDPDDYQIDPETFTYAAAWFNALGHAGARYIGGKGSATKALQECNRFTKNLEIKMAWNRAGKMAIHPHEHDVLDVYDVEADIEQGLNDISIPQFKYDKSNVVRTVLVAYLHQTSQNQFLANIDVTDLGTEEGKTENLQAFWLPSSLPEVI
jgi:hypothetical protein